jgi:prevent-host-death family protein
MRFATVRDLKNDTSTVLKQAADGDTVVVTSRGRPVALITQFDRDDLEELVLTKHLNLKAAMRNATSEGGARRSCER